MGRKARFTKDDFIKSALELLADQGLNGVTMANIAQRTEAPIGSVYHRFASREILMAELWVQLIESFQKGFVKELQKKNGKKTVLYTLKWIRKHPNKARVLLLFHREQLVKGDWPKDVKKRVESLITELNDSLMSFTKQCLGKASQKNLSRVSFCLFHAPSSAARHYLEVGEPVPRYFDQIVLETYQAVLEPYLINKESE